MIFYFGDYNINYNGTRTFKEVRQFYNKEFYNSMYLSSEFSDSLNGVMYINQDFGAFHFHDVRSNKQFTIINP